MKKSMLAAALLFAATHHAMAQQPPAAPAYRPIRSLMTESCFNAIFNRTLASPRRREPVAPAFQEALRIVPVELDPVPIFEESELFWAHAFPASGQMIFASPGDVVNAYYATDRRGNLVAAIHGNQYSSSSWRRPDLGTAGMRDEFAIFMNHVFLFAQGTGTCPR